MACFECSSSAMVINQLVPWITVGIFVASVALFCQLLKRDWRAWTSLVAVVVLMEELTLSLWLLINDVQILSPYFMDVCNEDNDASTRQSKYLQMVGGRAARSGPLCTRTGSVCRQHRDGFFSGRNGTAAGP
ncbi:hypothetical protein [Citrobacter freundii]|uniref:hypothetical protein n=1 Tax=Citrobacter freundii TaxID=546 RepID=UPI001EF0DAAF|nr:hypothetical protein [Citrobacter freundii]